jgi:hypothetical protein
MPSGKRFWENATGQGWRRLMSGEDVILEATNIKTEDRKRNAASVPLNLHVEYVVIDRSLE